MSLDYIVVIVCTTKNIITSTFAIRTSTYRRERNMELSFSMSFTRDNKHDTTYRDDATCSDSDTTGFSMSISRDTQPVPTDNQLTDNIVRHLDKCDIRMLKEFNHFLQDATQEQTTSKVSVHTITGLEALTKSITGMPQLSSTSGSHCFSTGKSTCRNRRARLDSALASCKNSTAC